MKKAIFIIALLFVVSFSYAQTTIKVLQEVSSADTVQVQVQLNIVRPGPKGDEITIWTHPSNTGTIQFSSTGEVINASHHAWTAGKSFTVYIKNSSKNLRYKASAAGQKFFVTQ